MVRVLGESLIAKMCLGLIAYIAILALIIGNLCSKFLGYSAGLDFFIIGALTILLLIYTYKAKFGTEIITYLAAILLFGYPLFLIILSIVSPPLLSVKTWLLIVVLGIICLYILPRYIFSKIIKKIFGFA